MSSDQEKHQFQQLKRCIMKESDMSAWINSQAHQEITSFLSHLNKIVLGLKFSDVPAKICSQNIKSVLGVLSRFEDILKETPPVDESSRFGNSSFRTWHEKINMEASSLISSMLPEGLKDASLEITSYLLASFGNSTRLDYGSGHELHFIIFLYCLSATRFFTEEDYAALCLVVFEKYLELVRQLQIEYRLEPAGSHGVWGLDDFQFVPYIWGSSQLKENASILPSSILDSESVREHKKEYMFFGCIDYIHQVKKGPFHEHSSILHGISSVRLWSKVNNGLMRMFEDEVLHKFPVAQHILFGTLFNFKQVEKP